MNSLFNRKRGVSSVFARLRASHAGNTLAMMAIGMIPLAGLVGGAIDMSRIYLTKTRLQQACDAGVLAGRKVMGGGTWSASNNAANTAALQFFDGNFKNGAYGTTDRTRAYTESAGKVSGTASAKVPMTMMKIFKAGDETVTVTCDAEMRLPNTDIMFVLDTTGSMDCDSNGNNCGSAGQNAKIVGLRRATLCFYEIVARLDTSATCGTGPGPSGGTGNQVQIRFGFMPYATNVNVGKLLPTNWFADSWQYQSRVRDGSAWTNWEFYENRNTNSDGNCSQIGDTDTVRYRSERYWNGNRNRCRYERQYLVPQWRYAPITTPISGLKNGTLWRDSFTMPLNNDGSDRTITWDGCVEERPTAKQASYTPIPANAYDLNIDLVPIAGDANSLWGPALPQLIYARDVTSDWNQLDRNDTTTTTNYYNNVPYFCPTEARMLQQWPTASAFETYVDGLTPSGNTYHDIGMIWGARFLSPTGIFRAQNEFTPQGGEIERHLIFMTDGDTVANNTDYGPYGFPWFDRRTTDDGSTPSNGQLVSQVDARFAAMCTAVKNKNITLWVVAFGNGTNAATNARMSSCASPSRYFLATDSDALISTFRSIADQISQLRLTK